jgi:hypothetical protein
MNNHKRLQISLLVCLLAVLAAGMLIFPVSARPDRAATLLTLSYGPADMLVSDDSLDYYTDGMGMIIEDGGGGGFLIPVHVPDGSYIKSIQLYAFDQNGGSDLCAYLYRNQFAQSTDTYMGGICTSGSSGEQVVQTWAIGPQYISEHHQPYLWVNIESMTLMSFIGVKIRYSPPSP